MNVLVTEIEQAIKNLTETAGLLYGGQDLSAPITPPRRKWLVLLCGTMLCAEDFSKREEAREQLRTEAHSHGIRPSEYVWIWDKTGRAQLLVSSFSDREKAEAYALRLRGKGLDVRLVREWDVDHTD